MSEPDISLSQSHADEPSHSSADLPEGWSLMATGLPSRSACTQFSTVRVPVTSIITRRSGCRQAMSAGVTAPLQASSGFRFAAIAQIARYNQHLLRGAAAVSGETH